MPIVDQSDLKPRTGSIYPEPYAAMMKGRSSLRLGEAGGLTQFGVNIVRLEPGALSSLRHWHENEDEFVFVLTPVTLIDDDGEHALGPGDAVAFPAGQDNAHHFRNDGKGEARFLVVGSRASAERAHYADVDLSVRVENGNATFMLRDGTPYEAPR